MALVTIETHYGQPGRLIFRVLNAFPIEDALKTVFGAEEAFELNTGSSFEYVDGSAALAIETGLIGEKADA